MKQKTSGFLNYKGLFGEQNKLILPEFIHLEPLEKRSRAYNWEIQEHLHNELYQLFCLTEGGGSFFSENKKEQLTTPCLVSIPANTLHGFSFEEGSKGIVLTLSESYLEDILKTYQEVLKYFYRLHIKSLNPGDDMLPQLRFLIELIEHDLLEDEAERIRIMPLLQLVLVTIFGSDRKDKEAFATIKNPSLKLFNGFQKLIRKSIRETMSVKEYAQALGISSVHLNRVCQQVAEKTATQLIHEKIIDEAKRYLLNTEYAISEVGYLLNFNDPAHFTKLFKKYVGVSPSEFRKH